MRLKLKLLMVSLTVVILSGLWLLTGSLPVAAAQAKSVVTLTHEIQTDRQGNQFMVLIAKVTQENGYPLSERSITFFETSDVFGTARVYLGSAITSAVGIASLKYETRQLGEHKYTVVYSGDENTTSAVVETTLDLQTLPPMEPLSPPVGLERINFWSMITVGVVVLIVWGLLAGVVVGTISGITRGSKGQ
jgi:hypothetical protein